MFESYTEMDRLVLERWPEVMGLIEAHKATQERIERVVEIAGERITRWVREQGFDGEMRAREGVYYAWRPSWRDKRKDATKVYFGLGGFCPTGFRREDAKHPFLWVHIEELASFKMKDAERAQFSRALRTALGEQARGWDDPEVDDTEQPLGRYLREYDEAARVKLVSDPGALVEFSKRNLPTVLSLADTIDSELQRLSGANP